MRAIEHDGHLLGLAALLDIQGGGHQFLTTDTIGGLTNQITRGANGYMGYMESYAVTAKRDGAKRIEPVEVLQAWADQQVSILRERKANPEQLYWAASNMSNMELDPIDAILFPLFLPGNQLALLTFDQIFNTLERTAIACIKSRRLDFAEINIPPVVVDGLPTLRPLSAGNLIRLSLKDGRPTYPQSLLGCLDRLVLRQGRELTYEVKPTPMQTIFGPMDALIIRLKSI